MSELHLTAPLTFEPFFVERMWGGRRLESEFGKKLPLQKRIGESWEIVDRPEAQSVVANGPLKGKTLHDLWTQHRKQIFGDATDAPRFPLLLKLLDAHQKLSLQVHPPGQFAGKLGGEPKTEFWYVAAANPGAELLLGFRKPSARDRFEKALREGTAADYVHKIPVRPGDAAFLPAGRLHAVSAGNLLIEIQQNSDTTYRVFDWNRVDDKGKQRQLHIEQALRCIDFEDVQPKLIQSEGELLISHSLFEIRKWTLDEHREVGAARPIRNHLLSHGKSQLCERRACARRDLSGAGLFAEPATKIARIANKPVAGDDSEIVAALCQQGRPMAVIDTPLQSYT